MEVGNYSISCKQEQPSEINGSRKLQHKLQPRNIQVRSMEEHANKVAGVQKGFCENTLARHVNHFNVFKKLFLWDLRDCMVRY